MVMTMDNRLKDVKVAFLVTDGFEQVELTEPKKSLEEAGAQTFIVSPQKDKVKGWQKTNWGDDFEVDILLDHAKVDDFDALVLPGGQINPDKLRAIEKAINFTKGFFDHGKPVGAICHGPWVLVEAGVLKGKKCTSYHSIKTDVMNAGGKWVDEEVVVDGNLITSRKPDDIPAFNAKLIEEFSIYVQEK
jgi:protease I